MLLVARRFDNRNPFRHLCDQRLHFKPCHRLAHTVVDAESEPEMRGGVPVHVERIGIFPEIRIAIGGPQIDKNLFLLSDFSTGEFDFLRRGAEQCLKRRIVADHLFDGIARLFRLCAQLLPFARMGRKTVKCIADGVDGGVQSGGQHRPDDEQCFFVVDMSFVGGAIGHHAEPVLV